MEEQKKKGENDEEMNLNFVIFEERMIKSRLVRDVNTVNDIPIRALFIIIHQNK